MCTLCKGLGDYDLRREKVGLWEAGSKRWALYTSLISHLDERGCVEWCIATSYLLPAFVLQDDY